MHALTLRILRVEGRAWFGLEGVGRGVEVGEEEVTLFRRRGVFVLAIEQSVGKTTADSVRTIWSAGATRVKWISEDSGKATLPPFLSCLKIYFCHEIK